MMTMDQFNKLSAEAKAKIMASFDSQRAEADRLRAENERLKAENARKNTLRLKVSEKGAISLYGMGRFPVTLYKSQFLRLLDYADTIRQFISDNDGALAEKS